MVTKFDFIRRFANDVQQIARLVAFRFDFEVDVTEEEVFEELLSRGYGVA